MRLEIPSESAASVCVSPAKKRSLTNSAACELCFASLVDASSKASRSTRGDSWTAASVAGRHDGPPHAAYVPVRRALLDENAPHGLGGSCKEMAPAVPMLGLVNIDQPDVRLVDQRGGLKRLAGILLGHLCSGQLPQFVVDQRQQLLGGGGVALFDGAEDMCDVAHGHARWREIACPQFIMLTGLHPHPIL